MNKKDILRGRILFKRVAQEGKRIHGRFIRCAYLLEPDAKVGVQVGFKVFARTMNAVRRNRVRRLMREAFEQERIVVDDAVNEAGVAARIILFYKGDDELDVRRMRLLHMLEDVRGICKRLAERITERT